MLKQASVVCLFLLFSLTCAKFIESDRDGAEKDINEKLIMLELDRVDNSLNKELLYDLLNRQRNKRSDIDSRLMELQAKIDLVKAYQQMPAGHGKFDFDKIGKRYLDPMKYVKKTEEN